MKKSRSGAKLTFRQYKKIFWIFLLCGSVILSSFPIMSFQSGYPVIGAAGLFILIGFIASLLFLFQFGKKKYYSDELDQAAWRT